MGATNVRLFPRTEGKPVINVAQFMAFFYADKIDAQEHKVRSMRERFRVRETIPDHEAYRDELFRFFAHYTKCIYGGDLDPYRAPEFTWKALQDLSQTDLKALERDAILGRSAGMIGIINALTEAMVKKSKENYMDHILIEYLPPDPRRQLDLARELVREYGSKLFPNDETILPEFLFGKIEVVLKEFALGRNHMQQRMRY